MIPLAYALTLNPTEMLLLLSMWTPFLLAALIIGKPKGRSMAWGLLGIFGVIVVSLLPPKVGTGLWEECPTCEIPIKVGETVCPHCQTDTTAA